MHCVLLSSAHPSNYSLQSAVKAHLKLVFPKITNLGLVGLADEISWNPETFPEKTKNLVDGTATKGGTSTTKLEGNSC